MEQSYKKLNPKAKIAMVLSSIQISLIVALILIVIRTIVHLFEITRPIHRSLDLVFLLILPYQFLKYYSLQQSATRDMPIGSVTLA